MKNKQRIIGGLMALCMSISVLPVSAGAARLDRFDDIPKNAWYYDAVDHMVAEDYFEGVSKNEFAPDATMTRAMFVTVLARYDNATYKTSQSAYIDVPAGEWYTGAVNWAAYNGLVDGKGSGRFDPDGYVTREEMCVIIDRYLQMKNLKLDKQNVSVGFQDAAKISTWADGAVKRCVQYGIVSGYPDNTVRPQGTATRAEVAAMIYRLAILAEGGALVEVPAGGTGGSAGGGVGGGSGGSGGGTGGSGGEETAISASDLVGQGLNKAVLLAHNSLNDGAGASAAKTSLDYEQGSGKKGTITIESEVELMEDFSTVLAEEAVETVNVAVAATTGKELTKSEIKNAVNYVSDELGVPVSSKLVDELAEELSRKTEGLGAAMHKELRNYKDGTEYPFTAIAVTGGSGSVLYTVDFSSGSPEVERSKIISTLAKELSAQLKDSLRSHKRATSKLDLEAELKLNFTIVEDEALAQCTDVVDVEISVVIEGDGTIEYYYDEMDHLVMEITLEQQEEYDEKINDLLQTALDKVLEDSDTKIPVGMDVETLLTGENVRALVSGDYDVLYDDIDTVVGSVLTEEQINDALENAGYDFTFGEIVESIFDNSTVKPGVKNTFRNYMVKAASKKISDKVEDTDYEDAVTSNVANSMAYAALSGLMEREFPKSNNVFEDGAESARKTVINSGELDELIDTVKEEKQVKKAVDTAKPFEKLMTFDSMREMPMGEFGDILRDKNVADAIDEQEESILEDITASLAAIPDGASVTIGGRKISAAKISAVKTANTSKAARLAVADVMDTLDTLTLADFDDGEKITVHYTGGDYTMNMTIYA